MRHPFDGIIGTNRGDFALDRRRTLGILASSAIGAGLVSQAIADDLPAADGEKDNPVRHELWFVVPENVRTFGATRRDEFEILGPYQAGLPGSEELARTRGFFAWATRERADWLAAQDEIAAVHLLTSELKPEMGRASEINRQLRISLSPNSWRTRPDEGTYASAKQIVEEWGDAFPADLVKFDIGPGGRYILAKLSDGHDAEKLLAAIKAHPQVAMLSWTGADVTTFAVGEEGATTQALGEEGGVPSTTALGEEGATTKALGEEGGSTEALGEEGGTTRAIGEEGGVTTFALGEEGGGISTRALGEEGGGLTTQALGEEGGR